MEQYLLLFSYINSNDVREFIITYEMSGFQSKMATLAVLSFQRVFPMNFQSRWDWIFNPQLFGLFPLLKIYDTICSFSIEFLLDLFFAVLICSALYTIYKLNQVPSVDLLWFIFGLNHLSSNKVSDKITFSIYRLLSFFKYVCCIR